MIRAADIPVPEPRTPAEVADLLALQAPPIHQNPPGYEDFAGNKIVDFESDVDGCRVKVVIYRDGRVHVQGIVSRDLAVTWVAALGAAPGAGTGRFPLPPAESTP